MDSPNDKPQKTDAFEDPKLYAVVGEEVFPRTGLETALVDFPHENASASTVNTGAGARTISSDSIIATDVICICNKVMVRSRSSGSDCGRYGCSCVGHTCSCVGNTCSCVGYATGRSGSGCRCAPVH